VSAMRLTTDDRVLRRKTARREEAPFVHKCQGVGTAATTLPHLPAATHGSGVSLQ
jgi:hypothetical protein